MNAVGSVMNAVGSTERRSSCEKIKLFSRYAV